ncbi:MAG: Rieske 2Fe-2S domain-containing protein, partial [Rhodospirillales bacterium]
MFLRNCWYVAAWDHELVRKKMMRRTLLNEPVVLYRRDDGTPVALEDRCVHRHAPLSAGKVLGDNVECP